MYPIVGKWKKTVSHRFSMDEQHRTELPPQVAISEASEQTEISTRKCGEGSECFTGSTLPEKSDSEKKFSVEAIGSLSCSVSPCGPEGVARKAQDEVNAESSRDVSMMLVSSADGKGNPEYNKQIVLHAIYEDLINERIDGDAVKYEDLITVLTKWKGDSEKLAKAEASNAQLQSRIKVLTDRLECLFDRLVDVHEANKVAVAAKDTVEAENERLIQTALMMKSKAKQARKLADLSDMRFNLGIPHLQSIAHDFLETLEAFGLNVSTDSEDLLEDFYQDAKFIRSLTEPVIGCAETSCNSDNIESMKKSTTPMKKSGDAQVAKRSTGKPKDSLNVEATEGVNQSKSSQIETATKNTEVTEAPGTSGKSGAVVLWEKFRDIGIKKSKLGSTQKALETRTVDTAAMDRNKRSSKPAAVPAVRKRGRPKKLAFEDPMQPPGKQAKVASKSEAKPGTSFDDDKDEDFKPSVPRKLRKNYWKTESTCGLWDYALLLLKVPVDPYKDIYVCAVCFENVSRKPALLRHICRTHKMHVMVDPKSARFKSDSSKVKRCIHCHESEQNLSSPHVQVDGYFSGDEADKVFKKWREDQVLWGRRLQVGDMKPV